jgi:hypothetical protein
MAFDPDESVYVVPLPTAAARRQRRLHLSIPDRDWKPGEPGRTDVASSLVVVVWINGVPCRLVLGEAANAINSKERLFQVQGRPYRLIEMCPLPPT